ncbi:MAG: (2Fe-2S)-binding protein, partial [Lachnospiraceae bacterium]|nr:(2Fe-2S)-binding protein [Lachnospiraceae bacterium]
MDAIKFMLNGVEAVYDGSAADRLLEVLRDSFDCKSVKCGCKEGECGACSVLIDGTLINSCCVAMGAVEGASILTLEGYRETERFAVLSKAFGEVSAVQCGF